MSVRSVATSVSPTSASRIFSSQSYSTESTMVTPTQGLVSQQILTVPSSSTIVDMATLNSLNMHSCNGTNIPCRNAHSLPSQESSFPIDPDPCISKVITSKTTSIDESSAVAQELFESSSLVSPQRSFPNSNCTYDISKQNTTTSALDVGTTESNVFAVNEGSELSKKIPLAKAASLESYLLMSGSGSQPDVGCIPELEYLNDCYCSSSIERLRDPSMEQVANRSCVIFENEQITSFLRSHPKIPYAKEDQNDNTLIFCHCRENIRDAHIFNASENVCSSCCHDNSRALGQALQKYYLQGQFNCGILSQEHSYTQLSTSESSESGKYPPWSLSSLSDKPLHISCLLPQLTKRSQYNNFYSGAKILSLSSILDEDHLNIFKFTLVMDPTCKISSNGFCEYYSPKVNNNSDLTHSDSRGNGLNDRYLLSKSRRIMFLEQLVLVLAEIPAFAEQFSLNLSEIIQASQRNLSCDRKALVMKKSSGLHSPDLNKNGNLGIIKVVSVKNYFIGGEESAHADPHVQMFVKVIPAADITIEMKSTSLNGVLPYELKPEEESIFSDFVSCVIAPMEKSFLDRELPLPRKKDDKSLFMGILVPSSQLLHSLSISICEKDSLSIKLGSSRPNQQYSTHTSVDLQLNGNNLEFIPIVPLGIYSQSESSDPDLKFLKPVAESSFRDVHNIEDIFLMHNGVQEEVLNAGTTSQKEIAFADIFSAKSSVCEAEECVKIPKDQHCFIILNDPEISSQGNVHSSLQPNILLGCLGDRPETNSKDANDTFSTISMLPEEELKGKNEKMSINIPGETIVNIVQFKENEDGVKHDGASPSGVLLPFHSECFNNEGKPTIHLPHLSPAVHPILRAISHKKYEAMSQPKVVSEKLELMEEVSLNNSQDSTNVSSSNFACTSPLPKNNYGGSLYHEQQAHNRDSEGLETLHSSYHSMKRKIHNKRSEGYLKPFRISRTSKNKPNVDLRKARETHVEENFVKVREDVNRKQLCSAGKSAAKHYSYGSSCLTMMKSIVSSSTHLNSLANSREDNSKKVEESHRSVFDCLKYDGESNTSVSPKFNHCGEFSSRGRGRHLSNFKSPDRKYNRNIFLSTTGSAKRSKLTILIFCLAVTSLLISLHALSTDSSLYIKPTFFLVQEEDTSTSSFSSESSYLKKSSVHQTENARIGGLMVASGPIYRSILVKEEVGMVKEKKGADGSITYFKSRKDTLNWTRSRESESMEIKSKKGLIGEMDLKGSSFEIAVGRNNEKSKPLSGIGKNLLNDSSGKNGSVLKPSISKSTFYFLKKANFTNQKTQVTNAVGINTEGPPKSVSEHTENLHLDSVTKNVVEQHAVTDPDIRSTSKESHTDGRNMVFGEVGAQKTTSPKDYKGGTLSSPENLTKPPPIDEGGNSNHNDFDLNIAFIEKNELNAAYGIDSATTGAEGNFEEDYMGEEEMTQMATSGNRIKFPKATRRLPQALIIGVRKGGTRALLEMLHLHPLVQKAAGEAHFFDRDENYAKGLQWYRRRMPPSLKGQITVEKSPSYFVTPEVPERVRAMNASIRLLLIVREPVTRAISDFAQLRSHSLAAKANSTMRTKLDGVDEDYGKKVARPLSSFESLAILPDGRVDMSWRPISVSLYHRHISAWLEAFPRDQILIVDGDQLASNPAPVLASVEKFLKLRPALTPTHFYFNATKGFYCLRSLPPGKPVDGMAMMPSSLSQSSLPEGKCLRESKGRRHPHVDPSVVHKLRRFFAEHNRRFYEMVGEDFGWPEE
ncbi:uncharacterized protein LOC124167338 [Ischnura elegans]|uniref:uncharacterized protein LOC124167338 n=1 Tax=Ischnura elegans TaxID=197161 RepID=UPI001ED889AD|nr:uncharacterized protein LOC124167338 [Ischnura elegans]